MIILSRDLRKNLIFGHPGRFDVKLTWVRIKISKFDKNILTRVKVGGIVLTKELTKESRCGLKWLPVA